MIELGIDMDSTPNGTQGKYRQTGLELKEKSKSSKKPIDKVNDIIIDHSLGIVDIAVYKRRFYVLAVLCMLSLSQCWVWNTWGPIAAATKHAYAWNDDDIAFFTNWGPITYVVTALPFSWIVDTKGLRWSMILASGLTAVGTALRCIARSPPANKWLIHIGQLLNGMAGPIPMGIGPALSVTWFPSHQRTMSTTVSVMALAFGFGLSSLLGPIIVPDSGYNSTRSLLNVSSSLNNGTTVGLSQDDEEKIIEAERHDIMIYMYGSCGICGALFLLILIYYPSKPPKAPSPSASTPRLDYLKGLKQLFTMGQFWHVAIIYGVSTGTRDAFLSMLTINLMDHGMSQSETGRLGFYGAIIGGVSSLIIARFTDVYQKRMKTFVLGLYVLTLVFCLWLGLQITETMPRMTATLYTAFFLLCLVNGGSGPLLFELACEITYPVSEGITNLSLTAQNNLAALAFLGILSVPNIGTVWMNWALIGAYGSTTVALIFLREGYGRIDVDEMAEK